ncbi:hypothetical protein [Sphingomonas sp.]|uniref:hypothetical protein n=1 Tax=Sphingomonas sp. TaxID=28214 RepID=UPI002DD67F8C|nr:hypothetical protein [Sphingomonas sp.]
MSEKSGNAIHSGLLARPHVQLQGPIDDALCSEFRCRLADAPAEGCALKMEVASLKARLYEIEDSVACEPGLVLDVIWGDFSDRSFFAHGAHRAMA